MLDFGNRSATMGAHRTAALTQPVETQTWRNAPERKKTMENTNTNTANDTKARKSPVTHQKLTIDALMGKDLGPSLVGHTDPVAVLERVIATIEAEANRPDLVEELTLLRDKFADAKGEPGQKGRKAPVAGETRAYSVQKIKDGDLFIRNPVDLLGVPKSGKVFVTFGDDKIVISRTDPRLAPKA